MRSSGPVSRMVRKLTRICLCPPRAHVKATGKKTLAREGYGRNPEPEQRNICPDKTGQTTCTSPLLPLDTHRKLLSWRAAPPTTILLAHETCSLAISRCMFALALLHCPQRQLFFDEPSTRTASVAAKSSFICTYVSAQRAHSYDKHERRQRSANYPNWREHAQSLKLNNTMDVCDEKVADEDDFPSCSMMIKAKNTIMKERIWINRVASEIVFQPFIWTPALHCTMSLSLLECGHL